MNKLPKVVRDYWYTIDWNVEAIWKLDLPTTEIPVRDLEWHLDVPIWPDGETRYRLTPRQVLADPSRYVAEAKRIDDASMAYPIDVFFNRDRLMILDGVHRLAKAWRQNRKSMRARLVPEGAVRKIGTIGAIRA